MDWPVSGVVFLPEYWRKAWLAVVLERSLHRYPDHEADVWHTDSTRVLVVIVFSPPRSVNVSVRTLRTCALIGMRKAGCRGESCAHVATWLEIILLSVCFCFFAGFWSNFPAEGVARVHELFQILSFCSAKKALKHYQNEKRELRAVSRVLSHSSFLYRRLTS